MSHCRQTRQVQVYENGPEEPEMYLLCDTLQCRLSVLALPAKLSGNQRCELHLLQWILHIWQPVPALPAGYVWADFIKWDFHM